MVRWLLSLLSLLSALVAVSTLGCWAGGTQLRPGMTLKAVPSPTLLSLTVDCRSGTGREDAGKEVISQTSYAAALIETLNGAVEAQGPALPAFAPSLCEALFAREALDDEDWGAPEPPMAVGKLLGRYRADSMLVSAVTNEWRCLSEGDHATSCQETLLTMVAYVFTADQVIWKSAWKLGVGNEPPDLSGGIDKLFEGIPLAEVARLQDPGAPTYERALEEAGVMP